MDWFFECWRWILIIPITLPIWGAFLWHGWEGSFRPRLVPAGEINRMADKLVQEHGPRAEEIAFIEEDRAWRYSDSFLQGKWRRVRRELWRRHGAGPGPQR